MRDALGDAREVVKRLPDSYEVRASLDPIRRGERLEELTRRTQGYFLAGRLYHSAGKPEKGAQLLLQALGKLGEAQAVQRKVRLDEFEAGTRR